jgi:hypothetical protein
MKTWDVGQCSMKMQYALRIRPRQTDKLIVGEQSTWFSLSRRKKSFQKEYCIIFKVNA